MKTQTSPKKKSPSSKARRKTLECGDTSPLSHGATCRPVPKRGHARALHRTTFRDSLPTAFERDTMLTPEWIAENVVQEVERFLKADLPDNFAERLAAKAQHLYPRHKHFHKGMNRPGWRGRENLLMFMRHWTAGWLKRERNPLHKKLPYSFGMGQRLAS
jgi:hypothetical protein